MAVDKTKVANVETAAYSGSLPLIVNRSKSLPEPICVSTVENKRPSNAELAERLEFWNHIDYLPPGFFPSNEFVDSSQGKYSDNAIGFVRETGEMIWMDIRQPEIAWCRDEKYKIERPPGIENFDAENCFKWYSYPAIAKIGYGYTFTTNPQLVINKSRHVI